MNNETTTEKTQEVFLKHWNAKEETADGRIQVMQNDKKGNTEYFAIIDKDGTVAVKIPVHAKITPTTLMAIAAELQVMVLAHFPNSPGAQRVMVQNQA